jgi:hypothetical protein
MTFFGFEACAAKADAASRDPAEDPRNSRRVETDKARSPHLIMWDNSSHIGAQNIYHTRLYKSTAKTSVSFSR